MDIEFLAQQNSCHHRGIEGFSGQTYNNMHFERIN